MDQWFKALVALPEDQGSVPSTCTETLELPVRHSVPFSGLHGNLLVWRLLMWLHTHKLINKILKREEIFGGKWSECACADVSVGEDNASGVWVSYSGFSPWQHCGGSLVVGTHSRTSSGCVNYRQYWALCIHPSLSIGITGLSSLSTLLPDLKNVYLFMLKGKKKR